MDQPKALKRRTLSPMRDIMTFGSIKSKVVPPRSERVGLQKVSVADRMALPDFGMNFL
jgi:hypothetical protein